MREKINNSWIGVAETPNTVHALASRYNHLDNYFTISEDHGKQYIVDILWEEFILQNEGIRLDTSFPERFLFGITNIANELREANYILGFMIHVNYNRRGYINSINLEITVRNLRTPFTISIDDIDEVSELREITFNII